MPREIVYGIDHFPVAEDGEGAEEVRVPVAVLHWSRETGDVQLVTRLLHHEVPTVEEHENGIPIGYGMYVSLNRTGINDLIRNLRRARDQAFGRDE
jgi:hypothetical protein